MSVHAIQAIDDLRNWGRPVLTTAEVAGRMHLSTPAASKLLARLSSKGLVTRLRRGRWLVANLEPFAPVAFLLSPQLCYVSGNSALAFHGMIDQVPRVVDVASTARSTTIVVGPVRYAVHHLTDALFGGWDMVGDIPIARPAKALFDTVYMAVARGVRVALLPELELPIGFSEVELRMWMARIESRRLARAVTRSLQQIVGLEAAAGGGVGPL